MVSPHADTHSHEHEWHVPEDDSAFIYEDGAMHVTERCRYVEEKCVGTSERLDESFYETIYKCERARSHRFDLTEIAVIYDNDERTVQVLEEGENVFDIAEDMSPTFIEEIEHDARERLTEQTDDHPLVHDWFGYDGVDTGEHTVEVRHDGTLYRLTYSRTEVHDL